MSGTPETVTFNGQVASNSYGYLSYGYDGFIWADVLAMGKQYVHAHEPDTGFASALHGEAVGYTSTASYGVVYSANLGESFSLNSGVFASAWDSDQPVVLTTFAYANGALQKHGTAVLYLNQTARTIDFANYGKTFRHIAAVVISVYPGIAGNQGYYGYQIAMDNLRVRWDGTIPVHRSHANIEHARHLSPLHAAHHGVPAHGAPCAPEHGVHSPAAHAQTPYHSQLLTWTHDPGGLSAQFSLPAVEHPLIG